MSDLAPETKKLKQRWKTTAGDTFIRELEWTNVDLSGYTELRCQIRGGHGLITPEATIDENVMRFKIPDGVTTVKMDGWEGDAEIRTPGGDLVTFLSIELVVDEQYTEPA